VLLVCGQAHTLLHASPGGGVLEVEHVLRVHGQRSHPGVEMRALEVGHGLKALMLYGALLIPNREKRERYCCYSSEAALTQLGKSGVCHHLVGGVGLAADDRPDHSSMGSMGTITLTSHTSMPWAMESWQW
jgi:hypothetical protein